MGQNRAIAVEPSALESDWFLQTGEKPALERITPKFKSLH